MPPQVDNDTLAIKMFDEVRRIRSYLEKQTSSSSPMKKKADPIPVKVVESKSEIFDAMFDFQVNVEKKRLIKEKEEKLQKEKERKAQTEFADVLRQSKEISAKSLQYTEETRRANRDKEENKQSFWDKVFTDIKRQGSVFKGLMNVPKTFFNHVTNNTKEYLKEKTTIGKLLQANGTLIGDVSQRLDENVRRAAEIKEEEIEARFKAMEQSAKQDLERGKITKEEYSQFLDKMSLIQQKALQKELTQQEQILLSQDKKKDPLEELLSLQKKKMKEDSSFSDDEEEAISRSIETMIRHLNNTSSDTGDFWRSLIDVKGPSLNVRIKESYLSGGFLAEGKSEKKEQGLGLFDMLSSFIPSLSKITSLFSSLGSAITSVIGTANGGLGLAGLGLAAGGLVASLATLKTSYEVTMDLNKAEQNAVQRRMDRAKTSQEGFMAQAKEVGLSERELRWGTQSGENARQFGLVSEAGERLTAEQLAAKKEYSEAQMQRAQDRIDELKKKQQDAFENKSSLSGSLGSLVGLGPKFDEKDNQELQTLQANIKDFKDSQYVFSSEIEKMKSEPLNKTFSDETSSLEKLKSEGITMKMSEEDPMTQEVRALRRDMKELLQANYRELNASNNKYNAFQISQNSMVSPITLSDTALQAAPQASEQMGTL